jgi:hypothetical protein
MKTILIAIGLFLVSINSFAHHTTGAADFRATQGNSGVSINGSGAGISTPNGSVYVNQPSARQPNIVTDPVSCIEKWGDACLEMDTTVDAHSPSLDLGTISVSDQIVPFEEGESIPSILGIEEPEPASE